MAEESKLSKYFISLAKRSAKYDGSIGSFDDQGLLDIFGKIKKKITPEKILDYACGFNTIPAFCAFKTWPQLKEFYYYERRDGLRKNYEAILQSFFKDVLGNSAGVVFSGGTYNLVDMLGGEYFKRLRANLIIKQSKSQAFHSLDETKVGFRAVLPKGRSIGDVERNNLRWSNKNKHSFDIVMANDVLVYLILHDVSTHIKTYPGDVVSSKSDIEEILSNFFPLAKLCKNYLVLYDSLAFGRGPKIWMGGLFAPPGDYQLKLTKPVTKYVLYLMRDVFKMKLAHQQNRKGGDFPEWRVFKTTPESKKVLKDLEPEMMKRFEE